MLLLDEKRYPEAIEALEAASRQNSTAANQAALAEAYDLSGQPDKVLPAWQKAVAAEPDRIELRLRYATALLQQQSFAEAARQYLEVVKRDPAQVEGWNGLGFCLYKVENFGGALKALKEAAGRGAAKPANVYLRAIIEDKLQMYPEAKASYEEFLALRAGMEDEEWKSRQRLKVIERVLRKR
jgi:tetratricopeptide (TPR) repeat protein